MAITSPERVRSDLAGLVHRGDGVRDFSLGVARILGRAVPFDGVCVLTMDPATGLPTSEVVENGLPQATTARMAKIEVRGGDFNSFAALARSERRADTLSAATEGDLDRSERHRELRRPNGFGDELRVAAVGDSATWGGLTLLRRSDRGHFTPSDTTLIGSLSGYLAEGLRRAMLLTALSPERRDQEDHAGLVLLAADDTITLSDAAADRWLDELGAGGSSAPLPPVISGVAWQARDITNGQAPEGAVARARVQAASGAWLLVRGSTLGDQTAVIVEPARPHELAPLIADAYGLTNRERAVTQLIAQGLPTSAIAGRLHLSPWTVQDHLKSIFEKVGVGTRGELVARVFFDHYAPRLTTGAAVGSDGWFASSS